MTPIMLTTINNNLCLLLSEQSPTEKIKNMQAAVTAAFRWRGNVPNNKAYKEYIDGENLIWLAKIMEGLISATVKKNELRIEFDADKDEGREYLLAAISAGIRWYGCIEEGATYNRDNRDRNNLVELVQLQEALFNTQYLEII